MTPTELRAGPAAGRRTCSDSPCFLCSLPEDVRQRLDRSSFAADYPPHTLLAHEGDPADRLIAVCRGSLRLLSYGEEGRARVLSVARGGSLVGLHAALLGQPLPFTAEVQEPTRAWLLPWEALQAVLAGEPKLWQRLAREAAACYQETLDALKRPPFERLVHLLLTTAGRGEARRGGRATVAMTERQIGEAVGLSARSIRRHLARLRERGLVARRGGRLQVLDADGLRRAAFVA
jgi:CRP/FNR family transcriptional regulator